ncbi:MAG TPA: hypothetical protein PKI61_01370 [bacterium]|nr:hypothetical protein [bacterium]HPT29537.1 hypothetical protein [bacterium]
MTLKNYLSVMGGLTAVLWGLFIAVMFLINPENTNWLGFLLFYLSLFLALAGIIAILGFLIRFKVKGQALILHSVKTAFRQSFLFAFLIVAVLWLLSQNLFSWLNLILLIIIISVLEFFLLGSKKTE